MRAFVRNERECEKSCSRDELCGHFKYFAADDSNQPLMCYHLKSCSKRVIKNQECPIEKNNYIDHTLFNVNNEECRAKCVNPSRGILLPPSLTCLPLHRTDN